MKNCINSWPSFTKKRNYKKGKRMNFVYSHLIGERVIFLTAKRPSNVYLVKDILAKIFLRLISLQICVDVTL